jgi:hypothetical protein
VHVSSGVDTQGINITIRPTRTSQLTVTASPPASVDRIDFSLVAAGLRVGGGLVDTPYAVPGKDGKFQFTGVVTGAYKLVAVSSLANRQITAIQEVYVNADATQEVTIALQHGIDISGQIILDGPLPDGVQLSQLKVVLTGLGNLQVLHPQNVAKVNADGSFVLRDVIPDLRYRIAGFGWPISVRSIRFDGSEVTNWLINVKRGQPTLQFRVVSF